MRQTTVIKERKSIEINTLGGFSIHVGEEVLSDSINRSMKIWNILSYIIMYRERPVSQAELIEQFWPDDHSSNPANALKTLLYRIRAMLESYFGPNEQPILSQRGSYYWNPGIDCHLDTDRFEALYRSASSNKLSDEERVDLYRQAMALYKGEFLPKLASSLWVIPFAAHYHNLYLDAVKELSTLLEKTEQFADITELCIRASELAPLDDTIHTLIVRSLLRQGKDAAALHHYEAATDLLYRNLGVRPSQELRALYDEIMDVERELETNLEVIQQELRETAARPGAFYCEYGFFREAYRLEVRRAARSGACLHLGLITVSLPNGDLPQLRALNATMDQLLEVLIANLRRGDVVSKYSGAQYVVMLPAANFEDTVMVMDRVVSAFYRQHRRNFLKLTYKVRELELE